MLLNELNHHVAQVTEGITDIGLLVGTPVHEGIGLVMMGHHKGTGTIQSVPLFAGLLHIVDEVGFLKEFISL